MSETDKTGRGSAFAELGLNRSIDLMLEEIRQLYLADSIPWVVGYSGGKDSTAVLQLVWMAVSDMPRDQLKKKIYVISTDTMVENPIVSGWVKKSLEKMTTVATQAGLPIHPHPLKPELKDTFWVNLIGKGYPAPRPKFRWCTERLKIKPSNKFIRDVVRGSGEAIVVLGTRKAESAGRAERMAKLESKRVRERLSPNISLPNSYVYSPVEDWSNDDVWVFLMRYPNPWGYRNKDLLTMYQGASADGECPLVIDTTTPSCGDSRFGCWVCTLVDKDKSMTAMIQNDEEKEWMLPLLELRNALDADDRDLRDFRRMAGRVQLYNDRYIPGPYTQKAREDWLRQLLRAQAWIRTHGPADFKDMELITIPELHEIRRIWVFDKHEVEDSLPGIFSKEMGFIYPGKPLKEHHAFGSEEMRLLREACGGDDLHFQLVRELLDVEDRYRTSARRSGLFEALDQALRRSAYTDIEDATERAKLERDTLDAARRGERDVVERIFRAAEAEETAARDNVPDDDALPELDSEELPEGMFIV